MNHRLILENRNSKKDCKTVIQTINNKLQFFVIIESINESLF